MRVENQPKKVWEDSRVYAQKPRLNMLFKNSLSVHLFDYHVPLPWFSACLQIPYVFSPQFDISTCLKIPSETFIKYANTEMLPFLYSQTERINKALRGMLKGIADIIQILKKNSSRSKNKNYYWVLNLKDKPLMSYPNCLFTRAQGEKRRRCCVNSSIFQWRLHFLT